MFQDAQDAFAKAMAPLGLVRGERGSDNRHEPISAFVARLKAQETQAEQREREALDARAAAARQEAFWRGLGDQVRFDAEQVRLDRARVVAEKARLEQEREEAEKQRVANLAEEARLDQVRRDLKANADDLVGQWDTLDDERAAFDEELVRQRLVAERAKAAQDDAESIQRGLVKIMAQARNYVEAVETLRGQLLPPSVVAAFRAAYQLRQEAQLVRPANDTSPQVNVAFAAIRAQASAIGR